MIIGIDIRPLMDKHYTGVSEYTFNLLLEIFRQDKKNNYKLFYNAYHDVADRIPRFDFPNVEVVKFSYPNKFLNYIFFKIFQRPKIDQLLGVDLFFMPHINFIALGPLCKKVITIHDLSFLHYPHYFSVRNNFWHKSINVKKFLPKFNKILTVSDNTQRDVRELCQIPSKKMQTIYSGISKRYRPIDCADPYLNEVKKRYHLPDDFILYLGTLEPRKNIEGIIEAYEHFREQHYADLIHFEGQAEVGDHRISLVIAGRRGWGYKGMYELARKSNYSDDIIFTDYITDEDKVYIYNLAKIFIYPSFYEGFGFPPLEAAACGTPTIVSNTSSLPEIIGKAAILIDPHNIIEMSQAITQLIYDEKLCEQLSQAGLEKAKQYSWEKCAREVIEVFEELGE